MINELWPTVGLCVYFLLFTASVVGTGIWVVKRRKEKPPVEFKLLRAPGESLRRRMAQFEEDYFFHFAVAAGMPLLAALLTMGLLLWLTPHMRLTYGLMIVAAVAAPVLFFAGRWMIKKLMRFRDDRLGYLGERAVGEALLPITAAGYHVFHDVPAEGKNGAAFNIDHVAVGPTGLFAIETKTRRKGRARPGFEAHKVAYDGRQLIWPWTEDDFGLQQAESRARWLSESLNKINGFGLAAKPVLVFPGWYVVPKGVGPVTVLNHKQLCAAIRRGENNVLSREQIDLLVRQLDDVCRDVED